MKKIDYLKTALQREISLSTAWVFSICAVSHAQTPTPYLIAYQPWGCEFIDENGETVRIEDSSPNTPLFLANEALYIDHEFFPNLGERVRTCIGNIIFNRQVIVAAFGEKYPYINGKKDIGSIEKSVISKLEDTPIEGSQRKQDVFYCDELVKFRDNVQLIRQYTQLFTYSATKKSIAPADGLEDEIKRLKQKYGDNLQDATTLAAYEAELKAFDKNYMKGDPAAGKFVSGKVADIHRKKLFLTVGKETLSFDSKPARTIVNSLDQGVDHNNPEDFVAAMNSLRVGSYSRGSETVNGGVAAKLLGRFGDNISIVDTDCGSKRGISEYVDKDNLDLFVGTYILDGAKVKLIKDAAEAGTYLGKKITSRSPAWCKLPAEKEQYCRVCFGENMYRYKDGMALPLKEIAGILLNTSMKAMHGKVLSLAKVDIYKHAS